MCIWTSTYSKTFSGIESKDIWKLWTDVNNWPAWHSGLEYCKLEEDLKVGSVFVLKPKGAFPVKIKITELEEGRSITDCTSFLGAKMYSAHRLEETSEGLQLSHVLRVTGPLKWLWVKLVAQKVAAAAPEMTEALVELARKKKA